MLICLYSFSTVQMFTYTYSIFLFSYFEGWSFILLNWETGNWNSRMLRRKSDPGIKNQNVLNPEQGFIITLQVLKKTSGL